MKLTILSAPNAIAVPMRAAIKYPRLLGEPLKYAMPAKSREITDKSGRTVPSNCVWRFCIDDCTVAKAISGIAKHSTMPKSAKITPLNFIKAFRL